MPRNNHTLNQHIKHTKAAKDPHTDTHFVVIDTWSFDELEHGFETRNEANAYRDQQNQLANTGTRWTVRERKGTF